RRYRQRRVAAQKQERERVIRLGQLLRARCLEGSQRHLATPTGTLAAPFVHKTPGGDRQQPRPRIVGNASLGPLERRSQECLLHRILTGVEVAVSPREPAEDPRREVTQQALDIRVCPHNSGGWSMT